MQISSMSENPADRVRVVSDWMLAVLATPTLTGRSFPLEAYCTLYIDGVPKHTMAGSWNVDSSFLYLPQEAVGRVPVFDRLAILAAIAAATGATANPRLGEAISAKLVALIKDGTMAVYSSIIGSTAPPQRLAINMDTSQLAAMMDGRWSYPSGAPAEVTDSWITMDF